MIREGISERIFSLWARNRNSILTAIVICSLIVVSFSGAFLIFHIGNVARNRENNVVATPHQTSSAWTWPTTTMQEPGWTNGTYYMGALDSVEHLNIYLAEDLYSFMLLDEIYDSPAQIAPNGTLIPWLATSWNELNVTSQHLTTFDPLTGSVQNVSYIWVVHIRPGVTWTDWTQSSASSTYVYSNHTSFSLYNFTTGAIQYFNYTYNWSSVKALTYYVQSPDFVLTWLMLSSSFDFSGTYLNVVNVVPDGNLTVEYYLNAQSASFVDYVLTDPILPYHIWVQHDWSATPGAWNYTGASNGYDEWNMNYNAATGVASGLVGTGPFMMNGGYGMPTGQLNTATGFWDLIVNPHYFVQYVPSLRQWTPKFFELAVPKYSSVSDAATAEKLGQIYTIEEGLPPTFIPTIATMPNTYIYHKPASSFGYIQLNSRPQYAPLNITAFRQALNYATDKAYISAVIDEGYNINGQNAIPVSDSVWYNATVPQYSYNPTLAYNMIKNISGMTNVNGKWYYNGKPVTITIQISTYSTNPLGVEGAEVVAQDWDSIGIPTTVEQMSFTTQVANTINYNFQATDLGITGIYGDPTGNFIVFYNSNYASAGFYFGPYTNITINGVFYSTTQITDLMNNLTNELNLVTNFSQRINIADEIEGIAAQESTMIGLGYPIDILEFTNTTFTGVVKDTLPYGAFMYWNFLSLHLRKTPLPVPTAPPIQLRVGVVTSQKVYWDGMYGNATVEVRNQYGQPVAGANIVMGYVPSGPLLNITSNNGTTNAQGLFTWEFRVVPQNSLPYTSDYAGEINISAAASLPSGNAQPGIGSTDIDVSPYPVAYETGPVPTLVYGAKPRTFNITVLNPQTGKPLSGYQYTIQVLTGAINMTTTSSAQTLNYLTSFNAFGFGFQNVTVRNGSHDYELTSISGTTGANGLISVNLSVNDSAVNFTAMGNPFESWIFVGDYAVGGPVVGESPYFQIGQMTSSTNSQGFGVEQPVDIPVQITRTAPSVVLSITTNTTAVAYDGNASVSVLALNVTTMKPVPNYTVILQSQNALGANRGLLLNSSGQEMQAYNPNQFFGSTFLPALQLTTNAMGYANATFTPELFTTNYYPNGSFESFSVLPYTDSYLIPFDEFQISAIGADMQVASTTIESTQFVNNVAPSPVAAVYIAGAQYLQGLQFIFANSTYDMYVNTTYNSAAGPFAPNVSVALSVSLGNISINTTSSGSTGSVLIKYTVPNVTAVQLVQIAITVNGQKYVQSVYVIPRSYVSVPVKVVSKTTKSVIPAYMYGLLGLFIALTVIFAALFAVSRSSRKRRSEEEEKPETK